MSCFYSECLEHQKTELNNQKIDCLIMWVRLWITAQKIKFFIQDFFSKCDQIRSLLRIWSYLLKKSLLKNFIFCAVIPLESTAWKELKRYSVSLRTQSECGKIRTRKTPNTDNTFYAVECSMLTIKKLKRHLVLKAIFDHVQYLNVVF